MAMKSDVVEEFRIAPEDFEPLFHIYPGFDDWDGPTPPRGVRALCGHVRDSDSPEARGEGPWACVVCEELYYS